jgi:hypothetical protein
MFNPKIYFKLLPHLKFNSYKFLIIYKHFLNLQTHVRNQRHEDDANFYEF